MATKPKLAPFSEHELNAIPRGDTCPGVNRTIIEKLGSRLGGVVGFWVLEYRGSARFLAALALLIMNGGQRVWVVRP